MQSRLPIAVLSFIFLVACNSNDKTTTDTSKDSVTTETSDTRSTTTGDVRANIQVTLTGGDMAGTYTPDCRDACCSWGIAGEKVFGNQYSETGKGEKELSSVQLVIDDVTTGNSKTTNEFMVTVSFGELFAENAKSFNINTTKGRNEDRVPVKDGKSVIDMISALMLFKRNADRYDFL